MHSIEIYENYWFYPLIWDKNMDFLDRKYSENPFVFFITPIPWHWWRLISIKSQLERLRSFFLQKIRFFYIFPYILVHNRRQNTNNVIRPPSGWGRSNFLCIFYTLPISISWAQYVYVAPSPSCLNIKWHFRLSGIYLRMRPELSKIAYYVNIL